MADNPYPCRERVAELQVVIEYLEKHRAKSDITARATYLLQLLEAVSKDMDVAYTLSHTRDFPEVLIALMSMYILELCWRLSQRVIQLCYALGDKPGEHSRPAVVKREYSIVKSEDGDYKRRYDPSKVEDDVASPVEREGEGKEGIPIESIESPVGLQVVVASKKYELPDDEITNSFRHAELLRANTFYMGLDEVRIEVLGLWIIIDRWFQDLQ